MGTKKYEVVSSSRDRIVLQKLPPMISISAVNKYDHNEGIAFDLRICNFDTNETYTETVPQSMASGTTYKRFPIEKGCNRITVSPLPPTGQSIGPKPLDDSFSRDVVIDSPSCQQILFEVTRKQSILHNIPMKFIVKSNPSSKGTEPIWELECMNQVAEHHLLIEKIAQQQQVDSNLVKAIVYMETSHGYYDKLVAPFDKNDSILPMNIRTSYWKDLGWTRVQLKDPANNITAGIFLLKRICERAEPKTIDVIASLYQDLGTDKITEYGARVNQIYKKALWNPSPTMLEQIEIEWARFNNATPFEQMDMLRRMFGG